MPKAKPSPSTALNILKFCSIQSFKQQKPTIVPIKSSSKPIQKSSIASLMLSKFSSKAKKPQLKVQLAPIFKRSQVQPKKPQNAFIMFSREIHLQMTKLARFKIMTLSEKTNVVSQSWARLTVDQKLVYNKAAQEDKKRYEKELKQLEKKGYFINEDGKDSRSIAKAIKKPINPIKNPKSRSKSIQTKDEFLFYPKPQKLVTKAITKDISETQEKKDDDVAKPKNPINAYTFLTKENLTKIQEQNTNSNIDPMQLNRDALKQTAQEWKSMNDDQKKKYQDLNKNDLDRYHKEMKEFKETGYFTNSDGVNSKFLNKKHRVQEFEQRTVMPKQVTSPYFCFNKEQFEIAKSQKKEDEKMNVIEITKKSSQDWKNLTYEQKSKYEKLSLADQQRYNKQLDDLRKNGFFTNEDGVKSTDMVFKPKKTPVRKPKRSESTATEK